MSNGEVCRIDKADKELFSMALAMKSQSAVGEIVCQITPISYKKEGDTMSIEVETLGEAVASLNVDLIDLDDVEELVDAVFVAAANICAFKKINLVELTDLLKASRSGADNNEFAILLSDATNVDWLYDEETKEKLMLVVEKFIEGIDFYSKNN